MCDFSHNSVEIVKNKMKCFPYVDTERRNLFNVVFIFTHVDDDDDEDCSNFPTYEEPNDTKEVPREPKDELNVRTVDGATNILNASDDRAAHNYTMSSVENETSNAVPAHEWHQ